MLCSNLEIKVNLMIDDKESKEYKKQIWCFPGDFAAELEPGKMRDARVRRQYFEDGQINEYLQTIVCLRCKRPCAGTCETTK
jgi:hypothetical protein